VIKATMSAFANAIGREKSPGQVKLDVAQTRTEILSGLTVALALVPEAVAFAFVAGVAPLVGLYAAFIVGCGSDGNFAADRGCVEARKIHSNGAPSGDVGFCEWTGYRDWTGPVGAV